MLHPGALVTTDVSEEIRVPNIRITRIGDLSSSETSVLTRAMWSNIPEDAILQKY
jgi:hypothetical protein